MILTRKGDEVFFGDKKLTINPQATKGPNKEVVKIEGLEGSNGQKWYALSKLKEGDNECICEAHSHSGGGGHRKDYILTDEEKAQIEEYQCKINDIIAKAKERYVPCPNLKKDITKMSEEERLDMIEKLTKYIDSMKAMKEA